MQQRDPDSTQPRPALIEGIDRKLAALLGTSPDQIVINNLLVHRPSKQIFLSTHRGRGPDAAPLSWG